MSDQESCFACRKHAGLEFVPGGSVYEDELVFSGHSWSAEDQQTPYLGGFIVEPKRHLPTWAELNDEESERIGKVIRDVSRALKTIVDAENRCFCAGSSCSSFTCLGCAPLSWHPKRALGS